MDERELIDRCRGGDEAAWADLYHLHSGSVARFLHRLLGVEAEAEDLVQQVFVELFTSLGRFRGDARLSTWLYRIASNVAHKHVRGRSRARRRVDALRTHALADAALPADNRGRAEASAELRRVLVAVEELDMDHRVVWVMREVEGLSTEEVALALGVREGTVRSRLFHARKRVIERLGDEGTTKTSAELRAERGPGREARVHP